MVIMDEQTGPMEQNRELRNKSLCTGELDI